MLHSLPHTDYFSLTSPQGEVCQGGNQDWYRDPWQRRAGCGPTTAATVLAYLAKAHPALSGLAPQGDPVWTDFLAYMEELWAYVTPGSRGLDRPEAFTVGCRSFALSRGCVLTEQILEIPALDQGARPTLEACRAFLCAALNAGCPVAFLNFSNGTLHNLDSWHWVPLIALNEWEDTLLCSVLDEGQEKVIDLGLWLQTAQLGGALAVLAPDVLSDSEPEPVCASAPLEIRPARPEDLDGVEETYTELLLHEQTFGSTTNWALNIYPTRAVAELSLAQGTLYVLAAGEQVLASMILNHLQAEDYQSIPWRWPARPEEVLVVHTLCIPPSQARKGFGKRMVRFALDKARATGCRVIRLDTSSRNQPAAKLYESFGFRLAGRAQVLHQGVIPGELIFFEKQL